MSEDFFVKNVHHVTKKASDNHRDGFEKRIKSVSNNKNLKNQKVKADDFDEDEPYVEMARGMRIK